MLISYSNDRLASFEHKFCIFSLHDPADTNLYIFTRKFKQNLIRINLLVRPLIFDIAKSVNSVNWLIYLNC